MYLYEYLLVCVCNAANIWHHAALYQKQRTANSHRFVFLMYFSWILNICCGLFCKLCQFFAFFLRWYLLAQQCNWLDTCILSFLILPFATHIYQLLQTQYMVEIDWLRRVFPYRAGTENDLNHNSSSSVESEHGTIIFVILWHSLHQVLGHIYQMWWKEVHCSYSCYSKHKCQILSYLSNCK